VRFNFVKHLGGMPDMGEFHRVIARIRPFGWHVDLHFDAGDLVEHTELLHKLPVPFLIDHMGRVPTKAGLEQEPFRRLIELLRNNQRCWVKVSGAERISSGGPPFKDAVPFAQALIAAPEHRQAHAQRWRPRRPDPAHDAGCGDAEADSRGQPAPFVWFQRLEPEAWAKEHNQ